MSNNEKVMELVVATHTIAERGANLPAAARLGGPWSPLRVLVLAISPDPPPPAAAGLLLRTRSPRTANGVSPPKSSCAPPCT